MVRHHKQDLKRDPNLENYPHDFHRYGQVESVTAAEGVRIIGLRRLKFVGFH